jgi:ParB/Sulfiredoxin domain
MSRKQASRNGNQDGIAVRCSHTGTANPKELKPNPRNPKKHSKPKIKLYAKIIKEVGWRRAIVVSSRSGMIVHGHGAQLAAIELGCKTVPIDTQDFDSDQAEQAAMLADNWLAETMLEYDQTLSADLVNDLKDSGFDMELTGVLASLAEEGIEVEVKKMTVMSPPKMAWVLIGIPTVDYGRISAMVEKVGNVEGVVIETTQNDG